MRYARWLYISLLLGLASLPARADFRVFACEPEWTVLAQQLMPDAQLTTATSYLQDPHYIEARPSLISAVRTADLVVCTGASLEAGWLPTLLQRAANPGVQPGKPGLFYAADHARLHVPHDHVDRSMGDVHPEGNPHMHLAPDELPKVARALAERMGDLRPEAAADIMARYIKWRGQWNQMRANWQRQAAELQGHSVIIQHTNFSYLLRWLGVEATIDLEPKPGLPPSSSHLSKLLTEPGLASADVILIASHQNPKPAEWLAQRTRKPVIVVPGTVTNEPPTDTLAGLISTIINHLEEQITEASDGSL
ncbi:metal ABC transporter solute-binding protein, Zn/Mn family [Marinobacter sp.]|uniref:metal ABC transporter solute-binding protein, Zn/Mn family n=1 Tax=Marinobacter sp. TaxID=50741 RepID=UPI003562B2DC